MQVYFLLILNQIIFGTNFLASKQIVGIMPPVFFSGFRFFISGLILLPFALTKGERISRKDFKKIVVPSILGISLSQVLFMVGISKTTATNAAFLTSLIPIITLLFFFLSHKKSPSIFEFSGILISFLALLILKISPEELSLGKEHLLGDFLFFLGVIATSFYILISGPLFKSISPLIGSSCMFLVGGFFALILSPFFHETLILTNFTSISLMIPLLYTILFATLLSYFLNNYILSKISVDTVALFIFLQPLVATLFSKLILDTPMTLSQVAALAAIALGVLLAKIQKILQKREKRNSN